jgi:hypothetical protein
MQNEGKSINPTLSRYSKRRESGNAVVETTNLERFNTFFDRFITQ